MDVYEVRENLSPNKKRYDVRIFRDGDWFILANVYSDSEWFMKWLVNQLNNNKPNGGKDDRGISDSTCESAGYDPNSEEGYF
jgi:hypothetical protein